MLIYPGPYHECDIANQGSRGRIQSTKPLQARISAIDVAEENVFLEGVWPFVEMGDNVEGILAIVDW